MRKRFLWTLGALAMALIGASCAKGETLGVGAGSVGGSAPKTTVSASSSSSSSSSGSTTSTTSSSGSTSSTSSSSGSGCPDSPCKVTSPQCGCAPGEACTVANGAVGCDMAGSDGEAQACGTSATDLCQAGLVCVSASSTVGQCLKFCDSDNDCQAPGGICLLQLDDGGGNSIPGVTICTPNCDPLTNSGCPSGSGCELRQETSGQMRQLTLCGEVGTKTQGKACSTTTNDCAPTYSCIDDGTGNVCLRNCDADAFNGCPGGLTCYPLQDQNMQPIVFNGVTYGVCD